ncbi:hypothetical protein [Leuconostoc citreum]|uniref:hypothetical protein n=1 Tax=Leuconostoc citreum TaxID=33964 RepID=UPI0032DFC2A5
MVNNLSKNIYSKLHQNERLLSHLVTNEFISRECSHSRLQQLLKQAVAARINKSNRLINQKKRLSQKEK